MTQINDYTAKATPIDSDQFILQETSAGLTKKTLWSSIKTTLKTYFDTLYTNATIASTAEAQAGTSDTTLISPLKMREGFNAAGTAPVYACRAWVNFDGSGTVAINGSGNVSSITDNAAGDYDVNFTTAIEDVDYAVVFGGSRVEGSVTSQYPPIVNSRAVGVTNIFTGVPSGSGNTLYSKSDHDLVCVAIFR